jgi:hypothetical protein
MRTRSVAAVSLVVLGIGAAGCGSGATPADRPAAAPPDPNAAEVSPAGDIPDNQAFVAYAPPGGGYSVKVPEGWARTSAGGAVTFTDKLNSITMETAPAKAAPTTGDVKRTELPRLAQRVPGFEPGQVSSVMRKSGRAVRITYLSKSKPDPVTGKTQTDAVERYVFFRNGSEVVLTLKGPKGADNVDPWKIVTDSLSFTA